MKKLTLRESIRARVAVKKKPECKVAVVENTRNSLVKELIKNEVAELKLSYAKMYSNILQDGTLRVKLYCLRGDDAKLLRESDEVLKKVTDLKLGKTEIVKTWCNSVVVYVDPNNIV